MFKQIKQLKEECSYTYGAMTYTLWYCKEILSKQLSTKYGLSLINYYYDEAKNYYTQQESNIKKMQELENIELKTRVVTINKKYNQNSSNLLNLNNLL